MTNLKQAFQNFRENFVANGYYEPIAFLNITKFEKEANKMLEAYGINPEPFELKELNVYRLVLVGIKNGHKVLVTITMKYRMHYRDFTYQIRFKVDGKTMKNAEFATWYN